MAREGRRHQIRNQLGLSRYGCFAVKATSKQEIVPDTLRLCYGCGHAPQPHFCDMCISDVSVMRPASAPRTSLGSVARVLMGRTPMQPVFRRGFLLAIKTVNNLEVVIQVEMLNYIVYRRNPTLRFASCLHTKFRCPTPTPRSSLLAGVPHL